MIYGDNIESINGCEGFFGEGAIQVMWQFSLAGDAREAKNVFGSPAPLGGGVVDTGGVPLAGGGIALELLAPREGLCRNGVRIDSSKNLFARRSWASERRWQVLR